jgi:hypothetical protein
VLPVQVLALEKTVLLLDESSPSADDRILADMGLHYFKGISNKARIFQVTLRMT